MPAICTKPPQNSTTRSLLSLPHIASPSATASRVWPKATYSATAGSSGAPAIRRTVASRPVGSLPSEDDGASTSPPPADDAASRPSSTSTPRSRVVSKSAASLDGGSASMCGRLTCVVRGNGGRKGSGMGLVVRGDTRHPVSE